MSNYYLVMSGRSIGDPAIIMYGLMEIPSTIVQVNEVAQSVIVKMNASRALATFPMRDVKVVENV